MEERDITYCKEHNCARVQLYGFDVCLFDELSRLIGKHVCDCHVNGNGLIDGLVFDARNYTVFVERVCREDEPGRERPLGGAPLELLDQVSGMELRTVQYVGHTYLGAHVCGDSFFELNFWKEDLLLIVWVKELRLYQYVAGKLANRACPD
jgi:hypothetical protein